MEQINILVVDDEKEIADLVEIYLVSDGNLKLHVSERRFSLWILGCINRF